jgi:signal transduction histidine kinase
VVDLGRSPAKSLGLLLALAAVALFEVLSLLQGVRSLRRLQARAVRDTEAQLALGRPSIDAALGSGGGRAAWDAAAATALQARLASEVEVIDAAGRSLYARPAPAPVGAELRPDQRREIAAGRAVTLAARDGGDVRVLSHLPVPGGALVLRLAAEVPDLAAEVRERQQVFLGHLTALAVLGLAVLLVLRRAPGAGPAPSSRALEAYEEAMGRLREHGEEEKARHDAERLRMEQAVREKGALARAGELTAGIVHEVRNGLGTIAGYARMLERGDVAAAPAEAGRAIREECDTLEVVVRRFADFVRLEELRLAPVDLSRLLSRVAGRELRGREGVELRVTGAESAGEAPADEELLERAVENVLRNAVTAAADGGGHVAVHVARTASAFEIRVEDDGPGLAADHPGEIRPFYSTRPGSLGLGLAFARKIMALHGGELSLARGATRGVVVRLTLPAAFDTAVS